MIGSLQPAILRQPWQIRRAQRPLAWTFAGLVLLALPPTLLAHWGGVTLPRYLGLLGTVLLTWLWWVQLGGLLRQNRPALARLLPGQLRALRWNLATQALIVGVAMAGCLSLAFEPLAEWCWLAAATLLLTAWLQRQPWLWLVVGLLPLLPVRPRGLLVPLVALPVALQALGWLVMLLGIVAVLGNGGAAHRRRFAADQRWLASLRAQTEGRPRPLAAQAALLRMLGALAVWPLRVHRRLLLRRARPANLLQRLDLGLHTGGHWPLLLWAAAVIATGLAAAALVVSWQRPATDWVHIVDVGRFGLCIGLFSLFGSSLSSRLPTLWGRRREQALLVLLPGLPTGAALAARLESKWRREQLALWGLAAAIVLAISSLGSAGSLVFAAAFAASCLPLPWLAQHLHRRLRSAPSPLVLWGAAPALAIVPAVAAQGASVPPWASLAAGAAVYALCARRGAAPARALLPIGR